MVDGLSIECSNGDSLTFKYYPKTEGHNFLLEEEMYWLKVEGHSDDLYNGFYWEDGEWNGYPHLVNDNGMHMYFYPGEADGGATGYWQLDDRTQNGTMDWYNGGYHYCADQYCDIAAEDAEDGQWTLDFFDGERLTFTYYDQGMRDQADPSAKESK